MDREEYALLQAIAKDLDDNTPRLIYADWLDENKPDSDHNKGHSYYAEWVRDREGLMEPSESHRATLIRIQIAIDKGLYPLPSGEHTLLTERLKDKCELSATKLLVYNWFKWDRELKVKTGCENLHYRRGFPEYLKVYEIGEFIKSNMLETDTNTITGLQVKSLQNHFSELMKCRGLTRIKSLCLSNNYIGDSDAAGIATCPYLTGLTELNLQETNISARGIGFIANSPGLATLKALWLSHDIGNEGAAAIITSRYLSLQTKILSLQTTGFNQLAEQLARDARIQREGRV